MRTFATTVIAGLAVSAAAVYHTDPDGRFGRAPYRFEAGWKEPQLLVYPFEPDERALRAAQFQVIPRPELVLLGSSRMMAVSSAMFQPELKTFNAGMTGATAKDYAALWQALVEAGKTPSQLIIYVDPWVFNKNSGQFRWRANGTLLARFQHRTGGTRAGHWRARASALEQKLSRLDHGFNALLNGPVFLTAASHLWTGRAQEAGPRLALEQDLPRGRPGWRADGSVSMGWTGHPLSETRKSALRFANETEVFALGRYERDPAEAGLLSSLIEDASRAGTKVMLIALPFHKVVLRRLSERPQYKGLIDRYAQELRELPGQGSRFSLCEAQDPEASRCSETEFEDGMHPLESCHEKVLRRCLALAPWKSLLARSDGPLASKQRRAEPASKASPAAPAPEGAARTRGSPVEWVFIRGGSYMMGAPDLGAEPVHRVTLKSFEMAKTLVTVEQYGACVRAGRCAPPDRGPDCNWGRPGRELHPVNCLDWAQARTFSEWIGGRLPSESEWEFAARSQGQDRMYPWGNEPATCERAVIFNGGEGCGEDLTAPVCSKPKGNSEQGLCDMAGNAREWVQDTFHISYEGAPDDGSAWETPHPQRIFRGGSTSCATENARVDVRSAYLAAYRDPRLGFRPVREAR
ncbi:MAG: SUMF1/EgtB/PvdO family nonheme iron enzyme [Elusimicrobiota bacterium]